MEGKLFTPNPERSFTKPVTFKVPAESGADTTASLPTRFKSLPRSELIALQEEGTDDDAYQRCVLGVDGVGDGAGGKLPEEEAKQVMADETAFVFAAMKTYYDAMLGNSRTKTSRKQRATG